MQNFSIGFVVRRDQALVISWSNLGPDQNVDGLRELRLEGIYDYADLAPLSPHSQNTYLG